ncbi:MAG TPA: tetratricopeptide repeat protein [Bacteroidales bacterium]|nr:tetratricopeptide repeat protein [Bacteroidales bacterium]HPS16638.1 tetratricopeptide repeat protein [Bacteroidales bacterium]
MQQLKNTLFILFVFISFASCGIFKHNKQPVLTETQILDNTSEYIDGLKDKEEGDYEKALTHFLSCARTDKSNPAPLYEIARIYYNQEKTELAIPYITKACELDPKNTWYKQLHAELLIVQKKYKEAAAVFESLALSNPENVDFFLNWAMANLYASKYSEAIEVYNKLEERIGITEEISLQKEKILLLQNKFSKAVEEIQKLVDAFPAETEYLNYLADLYVANKMTDEAFTVYQKILSLEPDNGNVHLSLAEYYRMKGDNEKSFDELKQAFSSSNVGIDTKIKILLSYYTITEKYDTLKEQAFSLCSLLVATHPNEAKAYSMYGDFLIRDHKLTEAKEQYQKAIAIDSSKYAIWEQLLYIESEQKNYSLLQNDSKRALELFPEQAGLYLMNGASLLMLKKYDEAITTLNKGVFMAAYDNSLLKNFYTYLGDSYYAKQSYKEAFSSYDKVLDIDSLNVYVLNNYSYYLSLRNENLDKAEKMAGRMIKVVSDNSSYLDTYAWVLFKENRFSDAEIFLKKALDAGGDKNAVILEHYGDVLYKLNKEDKALEYWQKAKDTGKASDLLDKKITDRKYYE